MRAALREHTVVWMDISDETAWRRAAGDDRPLAGDREAFVALHAERRPIYEAIADAYLPEGDRLVRRARPALEALADAPSGTKLVWAVTAGGEYPVFVGRGLIGGLPRPGRRAFVVTDEHVGAHYASALRDTHHTITIPAGEEHKTLAVAETVWRELAAQGMGRDDHLVALGGGVVGDLAGFCASAYQRGVPIVQVPTTVVAQVDSAYGGKTGVDLPEAKNYVGAYHQPAAVITDVDTLSTLPPEEHAAGYAEVVKTALIAGGTLWDRVASGALVDERVVLDCARTKIAVVAADERDGGARQLLNLGPHDRPRDRDRDALPQLPPRRGDRARAARRAAPERNGCSCASRSAACWPAPGCRRRCRRTSTPRRSWPRRGWTRSASATACRSCSCARPGDVRFGERVEPADVLAAVAELVPGLGPGAQYC